MGPYPLLANFSGRKFIARYGVTTEQFWAAGGQLYTSVTLPDDPPIQEAVDSPAVVAAAKNLTDRTQASDRFVSGIDLEAKALRALALIVMDEINILRAAVVPSLPARTLAQLKTAFTNKLTAGTAD
jgi:hypothetical protein